MKITVWFQITSKCEPEKVILSGNPSNDEINEYFENACGGVYKWWI